MYSVFYYSCYACRTAVFSSYTYKGEFYSAEGMSCAKCGCVDYQLTPFRYLPFEFQKKQKELFEERYE